MNEQELVSKIIISFYEKARKDVLIGYHFRHIQDFETHIPRIISFWEVQLLGKTESKIFPPFDLFNVHTPLNIKPGELGRWMVLFKKTLDEEFEDVQETELKQRWLEKLLFFELSFRRFFGL